MSRLTIIHSLGPCGRGAAIGVFTYRRAFINLVSHAQDLRHRAERFAFEIQIQALDEAYLQRKD